MGIKKQPKREDTMTKTAETKTVKCPIHKIEFPVSTCLARQKIVAEAPTSGIKGEAYKRFKESCGGCKIGLELYSEANKTAEIKPIEDGRAQVHTQEPETLLKPSKNDSSEKNLKRAHAGKISSGSRNKTMCLGLCVNIAQSAPE